MAVRTLYSSRSTHLTFASRKEWRRCGNLSSWLWHASVVAGVAQVRVLGLMLTLVL